MNRRMVLYVLCLIMRVEAVLLVPPLIIAFAQREDMAAFGFLAAIAALLGASLLTLLKKPRKKVFYAREGFIIVALAWFVVSIFGALPFWVSGAIPSFIDSLFDTDQCGGDANESFVLAQFYPLAGWYGRAGVRARDYAACEKFRKYNAYITCGKPGPAGR